MEKISIKDLKIEFIKKNNIIQNIKLDYDNKKEMDFFWEIYERLSEIKLIFNLCGDKEFC